MKQLIVSDAPIHHVRVGLSVGDEEEHHIFTFYNVRADDKWKAGELAKEKAAQEFGGYAKDWEAEYVWDAGILVDLKRDPIINPLCPLN